jgi:hypothetical protein
VILVHGNISLGKQGWVELKINRDGLVPRLCRNGMATSAGDGTAQSQSKEMVSTSGKSNIFMEHA